MWADVNKLKKEISLSGKEGSEQWSENFLSELEGGTVILIHEEFARLKRIMERRGRAPAHAIVAPIGTTKPSNSQSRYTGISFDVSVCLEERIKGKMEPELGEFKSLSAGTGLEALGQHCLSNGGMGRTMVDGCLLVDGSSDLREHTFSLEELVANLNTRS